MKNIGFTEKKPRIIKHKILLWDIKMSKKALTFGDTEIDKNKFYRHKNTIFEKDADAGKL